MPSTTLDPYRDKRSASATPEPFGRRRIPETGQLFVVQQHEARHLHFDLRLEIDGVLRSWAVPKGPSADPADKRFAALVEDHPLDYADFEGRIPDGNYGAGRVIVWDRGTWTPLNNVADGFKKGKLLFELNGFKLKGKWTLVRIKSKQNPDKGNDWLFIKETDAWVDTQKTYSDTSVLSGMSLKQLSKPATRYRTLKTQANKHGVAIKTSVPAKPMLANESESHDRKDWVYEFKYDGYRMMAVKEGGPVKLISRNGFDLSASFPEICQPLDLLPIDRFVIDGEIVVNDQRGVPSFSLLQQRARLAGELQVAVAAIEMPCTYYLFDALQIFTRDLRNEPLQVRKQMLQRLLPEHGPLVYSEHIVGHGRKTFETAVRLGLEGIVGKRLDSVYKAGRSDAWVKVRHQKTDDFVVVGWLPRRSSPKDIGA
ncbi:MAG: DNA ligase, partial [Proteobacteria bacterium]|nr:DNA ligase [Pseudomonadota bacterium]